MADTSIPTRAPGANPCDTFDPAAWLQAFKDVGGCWVIGADNRISIGVTLEAGNKPHRLRARDMFDEAFANHQIGAALRAHLVQTVGGDHGRD